jgi:hypothetical protein
MKTIVGSKMDERQMAMLILMMTGMKGEGIFGRDDETRRMTANSVLCADRTRRVMKEVSNKATRL